MRIVCKHNVFNLARQICTIVVNSSLRESRLSELKYYLILCKYLENIIMNGIAKAKSIPIEELRSSQDCESSEDIMPYTISYNPNYSDYFKCIKNSFALLKTVPETRTIFHNTKLIKSHRQPNNIKKILTRAKFDNSENHTVRKCLKERCQICSIILEGTTFTFKTVFKFKLNENVSCDTLNCAYVILCNGCEKEYIGETSNLRFRINLHKNHIYKDMGLNVSRHIHECAANKSPKFYVKPFYKVKIDNQFLLYKKGLHKILEMYLQHTHEYVAKHLGPYPYKYDFYAN